MGNDRWRMSRAVEGVEAEEGGAAGFGVELEGAVAAIFEEFDAGQRGAEADVEGAPVARVAQGGAEAQGGVTKEADGGHAGEEAAFPQDEVGVQVADSGLLELREFGANAVLAPEKGEGGGVVAEEEEALGGL